MSALAPGADAPDFTLENQDGNRVRLSDYRGKTVVLYFYPKDDTPGCTREACDFRDYDKYFTKLNAVIIGISKDSKASHAKFIDKYGLPFTLLSDPELRAIKAFGVWQKKNMMGHEDMGVVRSTFVINPQGRITHAFPKVKVDGHVVSILEDLKKELHV